MTTKSEYLKDKEKFKQKSRDAYHRKHPNARKLYLVSPEEREKTRKQKGLEYGRAYYAKNREKRNAYSRGWYARNPEKRPSKEKNSEYSKRSALKIKKLCITNYSNGLNCCSCCNESIIDFLAIDHINGNGSKHRLEIKVKGGDSMYRWLKRNNFPDGFQVLCHNCNWSKFKNKGICIHKLIK